MWERLNFLRLPIGSADNARIYITKIIRLVNWKGNRCNILSSVGAIGGEMSRLTSNVVTKAGRVVGASKDIAKAAYVLVVHLIVLAFFGGLGALVSSALAWGFSALIPFVPFWAWFCFFMLGALWWVVIASGGIAVWVSEKLGNP